MNIGQYRRPLNIGGIAQTSEKSQYMKNYFLPKNMHKHILNLLTEFSNKCIKRERWMGMLNEEIEGFPELCILAKALL